MEAATPEKGRKQAQAPILRPPEVAPAAAAEEVAIVRRKEGGRPRIGPPEANRRSATAAAAVVGVRNPRSGSDGIVGW